MWRGVGGGGGLGDAFLVLWGREVVELGEELEAPVGLRSLRARSGGWGPRITDMKSHTARGFATSSRFIRLKIYTLLLLLFILNFLTTLSTV